MGSPYKVVSAARVPVGGSSLQQFGNFVADPFGRGLYRLIEVDIALSHAARRVAEEGSDGEFGEAEIAREAGELVPKHVRRDRLKLGR